MLDKTTLEEWQQEFAEQNTVNGSMDSAKGLLRARTSHSVIRGGKIVPNKCRQSEVTFK